MGNVVDIPLTVIPLTAGAVHVLSGMETTLAVLEVCGGVVTAARVNV